MVISSAVPNIPSSKLLTIIMHSSFVILYASKIASSHNRTAELSIVFFCWHATLRKMARSGPRRTCTHSGCLAHRIFHRPLRPIRMTRVIWGPCHALIIHSIIRSTKTQGTLETHGITFGFAFPVSERKRCPATDCARVAVR